MSPLPLLLPAPRFVRRAGPFDGVIAELDRALQVLSGSSHSARDYPARAADAAETLTPEQKRLSAGLMRVNHVGEVCAQALYRGQALACKDEQAARFLRGAASEEVDHLAWCQRRLDELHSRPSLLNPVWYAGSFALGLAASAAGVQRNLGFMAETERQVEAHLDKHLKSLAPSDARSRVIVEQMRDDEIGHRRAAERQGPRRMPLPGRLLMQAMSKIMTTTAYWI